MTSPVSDAMMIARLRKAASADWSGRDPASVFTDAANYLAMKAKEEAADQPQNAEELLASDPDLTMRVSYERRILAAEMDAIRRVNGVLDWLKTCIRHARYTPDAIDHSAADTMENIVKRLEAAFEGYAADAGKQEAADPIDYCGIVQMSEEDTTPADPSLFERMRKVQSQTANQSPADEVERVMRDFKAGDMDAGGTIAVLERLARSAIKGQQSTVDEVERVAKILAAHGPFGDWQPWEEMGEAIRESWRPISRKILSAIRNGDEGMGS